MSTRASTAPGYGARLKAALTLVDWTIDDLAQRIATEQAKGRISQDHTLSKSTLSRMTREDRPPTDWELDVLASMLKVPEWFLRGGLQAGATASAEGSDAGWAAAIEILVRIEAKVDALQASANGRAARQAVRGRS